MPLPTPRSGESEDDFISRCMGNDVMVEEYPDEEQRSAICHRQWREERGVTVMERKSLNVEIKDAERGIIAAAFAKLEAKDLEDDWTLRGAFGEQKVRVSAYGHGSWGGELPIGKGTIREVDDEAVAELYFFMSTQHGREHFEVIKQMGDLQEWSYGYDVLQEGEITDEFREKGVRRVLKKVKVHEVSPVLVGAGLDTRTLAIKGLLSDPILVPLRFELVSEAKQADDDDEKQGFEIQTLIFPKDKWDSLEDVKAWAKKQEPPFRTDDVEETEQSWRLQQIDEDEFIRLRVICLSPGRDTPMEDCRVKAVGGPLKKAESYEAKSDEPHDAEIDTRVSARLIATTNFAGSPRSKYGTHGSKGFKGDYAAAWRCHFSKIGGGALTAQASGPIRGTVRRVSMIAAGMKPPCSLPGTDSVGPRKGPKSPLDCSFPSTPSDYGLSRWAKPSDDDLTQEDVQLTCKDLTVIKKAALAEIKRRAADREAEEGKSEEPGALQIMTDAEVTKGDWDEAAEIAAMDAAQLRQSALVFLGGDPEQKESYSLLYRDREGRINANAVRRAAARLPELDLPDAVRASVGERCEKLMDLLSEDIARTAEEAARREAEQKAAEEKAVTSAAIQEEIERERERLTRNLQKYGRNF